VTGFCEGDRWVVCGRYATVRDIVFARADTIVCLDHHRLRQTLRVARRTLRRVLRREELWNGNRERLGNLAFWRSPEESIVRWAWQGVPRARALFDRVEQEHGDRADVVRLRGWREVDAWVQSKTTVRLP
jgi:hypothetical protein